MRTIGVIGALLLLTACGADDSSSPSRSTTSRAASATTTTAVTVTTGAAGAAPKFSHVAVIVLENEGDAAVFGPNSEIPYLSKDLTAQGRRYTNYFATSHLSLGNYLSMVSGQPSNPATNLDCPKFSEFDLTATAADGVVNGEGCVYPTSVPTIGDQLVAKGLSWKNYAEDLSADGSPGCRHPELGGLDPTLRARPTDQYATRHVPFVYFHSVIDSPKCVDEVVDLSKLSTDLDSAATTPNLSFVTPNLCHDGHDQPCVNGEPGGMVSANKFLEEWAPKILGSPAFQKDGLLIVVFDEADSNESSGCCGSTDGGGRVALVMVGGGVLPGSTVDTSMNHFGLLCFLETGFGISKLGLAGKPDLYCGA